MKTRRPVAPILLARSLILFLGSVHESIPPMNIYYGGDEVLAGNAIEFARLAAAEGVDASLHEVPEMRHLFVFLAGRAPEVNQAIQEMGAWLRPKLGLPASTAA